jgi:2-amino-4-hydroxy-6-hydroxymethyldihydropteridine diphosphokinase
MVKLGFNAAHAWHFLAAARCGNPWQDACRTGGDFRFERTCNKRSTQMTLAYLGLGANLGDARQTLKDAVVCLAQHASLAIVAKSGFYRSAPVDATGDDYMNAVVAIETSLAAARLLALCHAIEHHFGRERPFHNAPRTLDLDLLLYGDDIIDTAELCVPHPRMTQRAFVLIPLVELNPDIVIPGLGRAADHVAAVAGQRIERVEFGQCRIPNRVPSS